MSKDELIYELTRTFSETPGETGVFIENYVPNRSDSTMNIMRPCTIVEVDTINGKQRILLS